MGVEQPDKAIRWSLADAGGGMRCLVAAAVTLLVATAAPVPAISQTNGFPDVAGTHKPAIDALALRGLFDGTLCADDNFCPDENIDRATMAVWVVRVLDGDDHPEPVTSTRFADVDAEHPHAAFIERLADFGVTVWHHGCGDGTKFCPDSTVTRAQTAVVLSAAFNLAAGPDPGFSDVSNGAWYAADVTKLAASGITAGCGDGTKFCPDSTVTRAQMATFLARALAILNEQSINDGSDGQGQAVVCLAAEEDTKLLVTSSSGSPFEYRSMNGQGNNIYNPTWGMAGTALLKLAPTSYADGVSTPTASRPSPRIISNLVFAQNESVPNSLGASDIAWQWGQFIDHDISLSPDNPGEPFPISVPNGDPVFDPRGTGQAVIHLNRSAFDPKTGLSQQNPRRQINAITAFIDASHVYGSDDSRAQILRTNDGTGRLKTSHKGRFLPFNEWRLENEGGNDLANLFVAGDLRVNEQIGLIAMHTLFVREHNRLAGIIAKQDLTLSGNDIYQLSRKMVAAQIQAITFNEFLPLLLGSGAIGPYSGYDPIVNPSIASEFSAAAYRVGHNLLSPNLLLIAADGKQDRISLARAFFNPSLIGDRGISAILRGFASQSAQDVDSRVINEVRNMLARGPNGPVFDLVALNIQRGRDHGVGDLNSVRRAYDLPSVESFADISSDSGVQRALYSAYGDVHDLDLWASAMAEDHQPGALVGETLQTIISDQFRRLRDGDRFWFENDPYFQANSELLDQIRHTTLANVIRCNTPIESDIQDNVFIVNEN